MILRLPIFDEKSFTKFGIEDLFACISYAFRGCDTILLQSLVFIFALCLLLIFVVVCQIFGDERSQWSTIDKSLNLTADIGKKLMVLLTFKLNT